MLKPSRSALAVGLIGLAASMPSSLSVCGGLADQRSPQSLRNAVVRGVRVSS